MNTYSLSYKYSAHGIISIFHIKLQNLHAWDSSNPIFFLTLQMIPVCSQVWKLVVCSLFWYKSQLTAFYLVLNYAAHIICKATFSLIPWLVTLAKICYLFSKVEILLREHRLYFHLMYFKYTVFCLHTVYVFVYTKTTFLFPNIRKVNFLLWPISSLLSEWNYYSEVRTLRKGSIIILKVYETANIT